MYSKLLCTHSSIFDNKWNIISSGEIKRDSHILWRLHIYLDHKLSLYKMPECIH